MHAIRPQGELAGLSGLGPGAHVCYVIDSDDRFEDETARCLAEGARAGQKLLRFMPAASIPAQPATDVMMIDPVEAFLGGGPLVTDVMLATFAHQTDEARRAGYTGIRLVADMDWLLTHPPSPQQIAAYELQLDRVVTALGATVVCAYRPGRFGEGVTEAAAVHPLSGGSELPRPSFQMWYVGDDSWVITGEIDLSNIDAFERALQAAAETGPVRRLHCAGLSFISAAGMAAIAGLAAAPTPRAMVIHDASEIVQLCWRALGLDELVPDVNFQPWAQPPVADGGDGGLIVERDGR